MTFALINLADFFSNNWLIIITIIVFILIFGLIIFVHELGHFLMAKRGGIKVNEFAFGFPPHIYCKKKGETRYCLNLIPFGGYCSMEGEEGSSNDKRSFSQKPVWTRVKVVIAGVLANFLLAWIFLTLWFWFVNIAQPAAYVMIAQVFSGSAAEKAGIQANDLAVSVNDQKILSAQQLSDLTRSKQGETVNISLRRFGKEKIKNVELSKDNEKPLGVALVDVGGTGEKIKWYLAPWYALVEIVNMIGVSAVFIGKIIAQLFGGEKVSGEVSGPVGIFGFLSQVVSMGWLYVWRFVAMISLAIGFFNILPIPALDGGRLVFIGIEAIARKKVVAQKVENGLIVAGFVLLIIMIIAVTYQDISKFIRSG